MPAGFERKSPMNENKSAVVSLSDIPAGSMRACTVGGREIVVCRTRDGVYALDNLCTHAFARLSEGRLRGTRLICPLHGAAFDVKDGRALGAPASKPLLVHDTRVEGDRVEVRLAQLAGDPPP
jgi:3-phenylpropionate/trans-cinnamate dioxygenase ferredoxin subunit